MKGAGWSTHRRIALTVAAALWALLLVAQGAAATTEFGQQTGKDCTYCHTVPGGPLTAEGEAFQANGNRLPTDTTVGGNDGVSTTAPAPGTTSPADGDSSGGSGGTGSSLLELPSWLRSLLLFAHLVAMVAWLGAIIFVHLVQSPRIAGRGIPGGYLKLAWPSIAVLGTSGIFLTLHAIPTFGSLTDTRWGRVLLVKIVLYLMLVSVATFVTLVVNPRLKRLADTAAGHPFAPHEHLKEDGRITFSYDGKVYDVTASRLWKDGHHARKHEAWRDLTTAIAGAPHGLEVLDRFPVIAGGAEQPTPRPVRFFIVLAYSNLLLVLGALFTVAVW